MVTIFTKFRTLILTALSLASLFPLGILFAAPTNLPLISRNCPAMVSDGYATGANDSNYGTTWRGSIPGWIAYDLSQVAPSQRQKVVVAWYNNDTYDYDHAVVNTNAYNNLKAYTLEGNAAAGGGSSAPTSGWVPLVNVTGNTYHSRQHVINFSGYNWLRLKITESDGSSGNTGASINLDIHNAAQGLEDDWIFYGDSITAGGMGVNSSGDGSFAQQINAAKPEYFPIAECGGIGGIFSTTGAKNIDNWLKIFPGKYVCLAFGTNDAWGNQTGPANYYKNLETMVKAILAVGKVPVVSKIPWSRLSDVQNNVPSYNAKVDELYAAYPQVVIGPDFGTYFKNNPALISSDGVHPSSEGYNALRKQWALTMLTNVYSGTAPSASPTVAPSETPAPSPSVTPSPSLSPSPTPTPTSSTGYVATWVSNDWGSGATITITLKNTGALPVTGWTLHWSFDGNQKITNLWNGEYQQVGNEITVTNAVYNGSIAANGGTVTLGFGISYSGSNVKPTQITVNGVTCPLQ